MAIKAEFSKYSVSLYDAVLDKLAKTGIDTDVKSNAILCAANLVSVCHPVLSPTQVQQVMQIFVERLNNELTRDATLKGLTMIALNETKLNERSGTDSPIIPLSNLGSFLKSFFELLKKTQRQLHLYTL